MISTAIGITETELIKQGVKAVRDIHVTELGDDKLTVKVQLRGQVEPVFLVTRREPNAPKQFRHRERLLRRLATVFPHIRKVTIEREPVIEVKLSEYR